MKGIKCSCPTCDAPVIMKVYGLDLVAETGDETLATSVYKYDTEERIEDAMSIWSHYNGGFSPKNIIYYASLTAEIAAGNIGMGVFDGIRFPLGVRLTSLENGELVIATPDTPEELIVGTVK